MRDDPKTISRQLREVARSLRKSMTPSEKVLWDRLRLNRLNGLHFRKQHPFGPFILDFACVPLLLGVELDGWVHEETVAYDLRRDEYLKKHGWTMVRFRNEEVVFDLEGVIQRIALVSSQVGGDDLV